MWRAPRRLAERRVLGDLAPANHCPRSRQHHRAGGARRQSRAYRRHPRRPGLRGPRGCGVRATYRSLECRCCARGPCSARLSARQRVEPFTERQIELVRTFADQAVIAIENARLLGELQARTRDLEESLEYQTATSDVLNVISRSTADVQPVLDTVTETAARLCGADNGAILIREGEVYRYVSASTARTERRSFGRSCASEQLSQVATASPGGWRSKAGLCMSRTSHDRPGLRDSRGCGVRATHRTWGAAAARQRARSASIMLSRKRVEPFTERQIELVRTFADQAVIAMENARLLGELQARTRDLEESLEYQTATSDVLKVISRSTSDVQPVLDTVIETAARLCGADTGSITIREGEVYR